MTKESELEGPLRKDELQRRVIVGTMWTALHTLISLPIAFGVNILLAQVLGLESYGRLTYLTTVIGIVSMIAGMGTGTAVLQFGAKAHAAGRREEVRELLSRTQGYRVFIAAPITAAVTIALVRLDLWAMVLAIVFGIFLPAALIGGNNCLSIENRSDRGAQIAIVGNALTQGAVIAAVLTAGTADAVWAARIVLSGVAMALALAVVSRDYRRAVLAPKNPFRLPRSFWRFALPTGLAAIVSSLVSDRTEVVLLEWMSTPASVGLFGLAYGLANHVYAPAASMVGPLVPGISGLQEIDASAVGRALARTVRAGGTVATFFMVCFLPAFAALLPVLYGAGFAPAADMLVVLGSVGAFVLLAGPLNAFLMARLGGGRMLSINVVALVVNVALAVWLIPWLGAWGAVIANAGAALTQFGLLLGGEARSLGIAPRRVVALLGPMVAGVVGVAAIWLPTAGLGPFARAGVCLVLGVVAFLVVTKVLRLGLDAGDADAIRGALPGKVRRVGDPALWVLTRREADAVRPAP